MALTIGEGTTRAQVLFAHVAPRTMTEGNLQRILSKILQEVVEPNIATGNITEYIAYVEDVDPSVKKRMRNVASIPGQIEFRTQSMVRSVLATKEAHEGLAFRKAGIASTHPPRFLKPTTLIVVIGCRRFLTDTADLLLERKGLLRQRSIDLIKEVADLEPNSPLGKRVRYVHVIIALEAWYRGYIEALGKTATTRSTAELLRHLNEQR